jgi:REP element-mobilizing transposase RayT
MPRFKRIREPGLLHHVMSRGNGRMTIFLDDVDYRKFLFILGDVFDVYDVDCWDMCAMPNHYHLTVMNHQPNLPRAMQHLNGEYATWWNARHGRVGHTFQGRYKDQIVQTERYLSNLAAYIALNPVRARLVKSPELWPWSAYPCTAGLAPNPGCLRPDLLLAHFGPGDVAVARQIYMRHVLQPLKDDNERYQEFRSRRRILGDRGFKLSLLKPLPVLAQMETLVASADAASCA